MGGAAGAARTIKEISLLCICSGERGREGMLCGTVRRGCLQENRRRKHLRERVGGGQGADERLRGAVQAELRKGLGAGGGSGRPSGAERQRVCGWPNRTPHPRCADYPARFHGLHHYFTLLMLCSQRPFPKQNNCGITVWGGCEGSARAVHPFKQTNTPSFQSSLE